MTLGAAILLFLPLCLVICLVSSTLRRDSLQEIVRHALRLFVYLTVVIFVSCAAIHFVMEWLLP